MELLYLLSSIICNSLTSLALSIILPLRRLFLSPATTHTESVTLYEGVVWHQRRRPVHHSFNYRVRYALFELDRHTHAPPNHLSADEARTAAGTTGPVFLLTIPPSVGYEQNPLSLYYCYDLEDSTRQLKKCIAEVTNTPWGERVSFVFSPSSDLVAKPLHVSPFMDMLGNWRIKATEPGDDLSVSILVQHPHLGEYFCATLRAKRVPHSMVPDHTLFFWLMPHKVAVWIYWHVSDIKENKRLIYSDPVQSHSTIIVKTIITQLHYRGGPGRVHTPGPLILPNLSNGSFGSCSVRVCVVFGFVQFGSNSGICCFYFIMIIDFILAKLISVRFGSGLFRFGSDSGHLISSSIRVWVGSFGSGQFCKV